jgi:hypothetical protein
MPDQFQLRLLPDCPSVVVIANTGRSGVIENAPDRCPSENEELLMAPKIIVRSPNTPRVRQRAILMFREWDASMTRDHGPLYYRRMGYTVH